MAGKDNWHGPRAFAWVFHTGEKKALDALASADDESADDDLDNRYLNYFFIPKHVVVHI